VPILAPGVIHIPTSKSDNAFLVEGDDGLTLVDVGRSKAVDLLLQTIGELGYGPAGFAAHPDARATGAARIPADVTAIGFGHGAPVRTGGRRLPRIPGNATLTAPLVAASTKYHLHHVLASRPVAA
jgi:hypothetical protein